MTNIVLAKDVPCLYVHSVYIVTAWNTASFTVGRSLEIDMRSHEVLASRELPTMEIIDKVDSLDFQDALTDVISSDIMRCLFHKNGENIHEHSDRGTENNNGEDESADWVNNLVLV